MSLYDDTIAMLGLTMRRRALLSRVPDAAKPCAKFAQANFPRAGPLSAAAARRSRYRRRCSALRSAMRFVTSAFIGFVMRPPHASDGRRARARWLRRPGRRCPPDTALAPG